MTLQILYHSPFKLQPEDGFIKSRNISLLWSCNYLLIIFI